MAGHCEDCVNTVNHVCMWPYPACLVQGTNCMCQVNIFTGFCLELVDWYDVFAFPGRWIF